MRGWTQAAWTAGALTYGLLAALFLVFRTLFTDAPADPLHPELLFAHALTAVGYGVPTALLVRFRPAPLGWWPAWLGAPGLLVVALYVEPPAALRLWTLGAVVVGLAAGVVVGGWLRGRRAHRANRSTDIP